MSPLLFIIFFFFFNDTATTEIYTLSLHDALPISLGTFPDFGFWTLDSGLIGPWTHLNLVGSHSYEIQMSPDRKSTRLNSSHLVISYAVFCLKKKKKKISIPPYIHITSDDSMTQQC